MTSRNFSSNFQNILSLSVIIIVKVFYVIKILRGELKNTMGFIIIQPFVLYVDGCVIFAYRLICLPLQMWCWHFLMFRFFLFLKISWISYIFRIMFRNQYDSDVTIWSPQGRLHQVYHWRFSFVSFVQSSWGNLIHASPSCGP